MVDPIQAEAAPAGWPAGSTTASLNRSSSGVARNALFGYLTLIVSTLAGVVLTPIIYRGVGVADFGVLSVAVSAVSYTGLVELGISTATTRRVAEVELNGPEALSVVARTAWVLHGAASLVCAALCTVLAIVYPYVFDVRSESASTVRVMVLLLGLWQAVQVISNVFVALLYGTGRLYVAARAGSVMSVLASAGQAAVVLAGWGTAAIAGVLAASALLNAAVLGRLVRKHLHEAGPADGHFDGAEARRLVSSGWRISLNYVAGTIAFGADIVVVGVLLPARDAAAYAVAQKGAGLAKQLLQKLVDGLLPTYASVTDDPVLAARVYRDALVYTGLLAMPMGAVMVLFGRPLLTAWLGAIPDGTVSVLALLGVLLIATVPGTNAASCLLGMGRAGTLARITTLGAAINLPVSVGLTLWLGIIGPALGSLVAVALVDVVILPVLVCRALGVGVGALARGCAAALAPSSAGVLIVCLGLRSTGDGTAVAAAAAFLAVPVSLLAWFALAAGEADRARVQRLAAPVMRRLGREPDQSLPGESGDSTEVTGPEKR